ncbi:hypothetical protein QUB68_29580 [Microcoleus sp. A006_D1]|uniref:hypothetical protein n=1 Tax=Microcoleus sp. A006_D1 TaxID=3055267 RepID=UPI002FD45071
MEFLNFRGQQLEATIVSTGGQDFVIAAVGDRMDATATRIYAQQKIDIVAGLEVMEIATGTRYKVLSPPEGFMRQVMIKDIARNLTPIAVTEDVLRQKYRFMSA